MTIEQKGRIVTDTRYITPLGGVWGILRGRSDSVTGISLVPDKNHSTNDSVVLETNSEKAKLLVGPEINSDPICRKHNIRWQP